MCFCFSNCDFIYSNVTVFLYSYLTITLLLLPIGGNKLPYLPAPQVASVSESVHSSRSFTFPSVSGDYIVWSQIYVASGLGCDHPKSQIRYTNSPPPSFSHAVSLSDDPISHTQILDPWLHSFLTISQCVCLLTLLWIPHLFVAFRLQFLTGIEIIIRCVIGCIWQVGFCSVHCGWR